jgi:diaminopimelate decarboxylase
MRPPDRNARTVGDGDHRGDRIAPVLVAAISRGLLSEDRPVCLLLDLEAFRDRVRALQAGFPPGTLHALAVKALPLLRLLGEARSLGMGLECASSGELALAERAGFEAEAVIFDSPAKTPAEIRRALSRGYHLNVDNLQELERVDRLLSEIRQTGGIGIRVNPQVGAGEIETTGTAASTSKFGVALREQRGLLLEAFRRHPWIRGLHVHTGSQGCSLDLLAGSVGAVANLAEELGPGRVDTIDIGGGLPVAYRAGETAPSFEEYAERLRREVPALFGGGYRIVTEFGRSLVAPCGVIASRVEYTKTAAGSRIAVIHAGADLLLRSAYLPDVWWHEITVHHPSGAPKAGAPVEQDIAGPLCFSGDYVGRCRRLPPIEPGDLVVIHDAAAYTLAMWSRYNSRPAPAVYGYVPEPEPAFECLKPSEKEEEIVRFWGG